MEGGFLALESTDALKGTLPVKIQAVGASVGVDTIQNYLHTQLVSLFTKGLKILCGAQHWVRNFIVAGIVTMIGKSLADGIQIENGHTQVCNV